ncbi:MAG: lamin tail domain-containing protein [Paludibacteraceae bacterium]|nr:lamin tail domain-containing protein [Paludibacteraceae bacterium]
MRLFYLFVFLFVSCSTVLCASKGRQYDGNKMFEFWSGEKENFILTDSSLQLHAPRELRKSYLFTPSSVFGEAEWRMRLRLGFNPSGSNYVRFYLSSNSPDLKGSLEGYFVQVGNASDQILLYRQSGTSVKKLVASATQRLDFDSLIVDIRVNRTATGAWSLASKINGEPSFSVDGTANDSTFTSCYFMGIFCNFTTTRREQFYFDYFSVQGEEFRDEEPPTILKVEKSDTCVRLSFSERIDSLQAACYMDGEPLSGFWNASSTQLTLNFDSPLQRGVLHRLSLDGIVDMAGNRLKDTLLEVVLAEPLKQGDLIINELLFHPYQGGVDYVELYNRSGNYVNLGGLLLASYKSDTLLYAAKRLPDRLLAPEEYVVLTTDSDAVCQFYDCQGNDVFLILEKLPAYGNSKGSVVLATRDSLVIDDFIYQESMHDELLKGKEGVALERVSPDSKEWVSASATSHFGTPGYRNSSVSSGLEEVRLAQEVCYPQRGEEGGIRLSYSFSQPGYFAYVSVFNLNGVCVRHLLQNQLLGTSGEIEWDAKSDNGVLQPIAPYIILFEAHNAQGELVRKKFVCVVSQ